MEVVIYGKDNCIHCERVKNWFKAKNIPFEYINLDTPEKKKEFFKRLGNNVTTVPQIIIDGEHIGGFSDLLESDFAQKQ